MESARAKYTLALGRMRRGPPELALLSLHGSIEDALRGYALQRRLPAGYEPFPQLVGALVTDAQAPISAEEAEVIRRMHRLRARVAHGEQINLAAGTIEAYHRLAARALPRCGVLVVGPEESAETARLPRPDDAAAPPRRRGDDVPAIPPRRSAEDGRTTTRMARPPRERSAYPDDELARYTARQRPGRAPAGDRGRITRQADRWRRSQSWLLPLLIIVSIFLIGAAVSISLQQIRAARSFPTAAAATASASPPEITTMTPLASAETGAAINSVMASAPSATAATATPSPTTAAATGIAVGRSARVASQIPLNVRDRPGTDPTIPILLVLQPGTQAEVIDGPVEADGHLWWKVRAANSEGWCAGEFLEPQ